MNHNAQEVKVTVTVSFNLAIFLGVQVVETSVSILSSLQEPFEAARFRCRAQYRLE